MGKDTHIPIFLHSFGGVEPLARERVGPRVWSTQWVAFEHLSKFGYLGGLLQDVREKVQSKLIDFIRMPFLQVRYNFRGEEEDSPVEKE